MERKQVKCSSLLESVVSFSSNRDKNFTAALSVLSLIRYNVLRTRINLPVYDESATPLVGADDAAMQ